MAEDIRSPSARREPPPEVALDTPLRTAAGTPVAAWLTITNRAGAARVMAISVLGVDATWLPRPTRSQAVEPGAAIVAEVTVSPAPGTVPARYPLAIAVEALDAVTGLPTAPTQLLDAELIVDAPGQIDLELATTEARAVFTKRLRITVHNTGNDDAPVQLEGQTTDAVRLSLPAEEFVVSAGRSVRLRARLRSRSPAMFGHPTRHAYTVTARSSGAPRHVEASFTTRALLGPGTTKAIVLTTIIAVWVALGIVFIPKLADFVRQHAGDAANSVLAGGQSSSAQPSAGRGGHSGAAGGGHSGSGGGTRKEGGGGNGGGGNSNGGNGNGGNSNGGSGSAGNGGGSGAAATHGSQSAGKVQINGTVGGAAPAGVSVQIRPTPLVDEKAVGATPNPAGPQNFGPVGMIPAAAIVQHPTSSVSRAQQESTKQDGAWSFAVDAPGYYLLTFAKPGYDTQRYVIDSAKAIATQPLKVVLAPGSGHLDGVVTGPSGAVGGAQITITDGTNTITTSSNSRGQVGHWSVDGLSTPSAYLVTISRDGLSTESKLVQLAAGDSQTVDLQLRHGVATLMGKVMARDDQDTLVGVGGAHVTVSDGATSRSTTTITAGAGGVDKPVGEYRLPGLAPGTYTVTIEAAGYQVETRRLVLRSGESDHTMDAVLGSAFAIVSGHVQGQVLDHDGNVVLGRNGQPKLQYEVNAGLTFTSDANTYKITTDDSGSFRFGGVAPGTYVVTAQFPGLRTTFKTVSVKGGGDNATVEFVLVRDKVDNDATITGFVGDATNPSNTVTCLADPNCMLHFELVDSAGNPAPVKPADVKPAEFGATNYTLASAAGGFAPGLYRLTIRATNYLPATVNVLVPQHGVGRAPSVSLTVADTVTGVVTFLGDLSKDATGQTWQNCVVAVPLPLDTGAPPSNCDAPATNSCTATGVPDIGVGQITGTPGHYKIENLCDSSYTLYVLITNPDYYNDLVPFAVPLSNGRPYDYSFSVARKGRIMLSLDKPNPDTGVLNPVPPGTDVKVTCVGPATVGPLTLTTGADSAVTVTGLPDGSWICSAATVAAPVLSGSTAQLIVTRDGTATSELTLAASIGAITGRVTTAWSGTAQPLGSATVRVTGVVGYANGQPVTRDVNATTDSQGCFIIVPTDTASATPSGGCSADTPRYTLGLITQSATFQASAPNYRTSSDTEHDLSAGSFVPLSLSPTSVAISGTLTVDPLPLGTDVDVSDTSFQVVQQPPGAGTVRVSVSGNAPAAIVWNDSNIPDALHPAQPGNYTLRATLAGYAPATVQVSCDIGTACTIGTITLAELGTLTIKTVTVVDPSLGTTAPVPDAAVTLRTGSTSLGTQRPRPGDNSVTFTGIVPGTGYVAHIQAAGYQFGDLGNGGIVSPDCSDPLKITSGADQTCTAQLVPLGTIRGTVRGALGDPATSPANALANATVSAQHCAGSDTDPAATACASLDGPVFTAVTNADGTFRITGTASAEGLHTGWWKITAAASGYHAADPAYAKVTQADIVARQDTVQDVVLVADRVQLEIRVLDANGAAIKNNLTFTVTNLSTGETLDAPSKPDRSGCNTTGDCDYWDFGSDVIPTSYSVSISGNAIGTINTSISLLVGISPQRLTIQANQSSGSISGTVSAVQGANQASTGLGGVKLTLGHYAQDGTFTPTMVGGKALEATTSSGGGSPAGFFAISNIPISDTAYDIQVTPVTGYYLPSGSTPTVTVSAAGSVVPVALALQRVQRNVKITLTASSTSDDLAGAPVSLTPSPAGSNPSFSGYTLNGSGGTFTTSIPQVPFGDYTLSITLPKDHYGPLGGATFTCSSAAARVCKAGVTVPATVADTDTDYPLDLTISEFAISLDVDLAALTSDERAGPAEVALAVTKTGATDPIFTDPTFDVTATTGVPIWVPDDPSGQTTPKYKVTATPDPDTFPGWPAGSETLDASSPSSSKITLQEVGATVVVTVTQKKKDLPTGTTANVVLSTAISGINWTDPGKDTGTGRKQGEASFDDVPISAASTDTWTATATIDTSSGTSDFAVTLAGTGCTTTGGNTTCAVAVDVP
ncbi:MAG TPA: carboxypeptidase-like regulatory domain-containing protein [Jatrophihabitans sp.]|nr:carboxypeptidase-like regulatory domain-containing protein [Jatrophihabitans sp.]